MSNPALHDLAERCKAAPARGEIERHVEQIAALPIGTGIVLVEHVDLGRSRQSEHRHQRRQRLVAEAGDGLLVGRHQRALVQRQLLRPEKQLGGTQHERIVAVVQHVAQDHVHDLVQEYVRELEVAPHDVEIGRLQRAVARQMIAEGDHHLPVLARIGIGDGGNLRRADRLPRVGQQRAVQRALGGAGVRRRRDLGPRQIGLQEFIGDEQPAARIAIEQMMAAGQPEVARLAHVRSPFAIVMRSTCSCGGSSSPATSRNA